MEIVTTANGNKLTYFLSGRLDNSSAPRLEAQLNALSGNEELTFDFEHLEYISSAGLRLLLLAKKKLACTEQMKLVHVKPIIMEVLKITGLSRIMTIE